MEQDVYTEALAERMRRARHELAGRWLERIRQLGPLRSKEVFPGSDLIDHMPLLIDGIAGFLEKPAADITAEAPVLGKAIELGRLRYEQGFDATQILREYQVLGEVLFEFMLRQTEQLEVAGPHSNVLNAANRIFHSIALIQRHTTSAFLALDDERVKEQQDRLRSFNRMVSHELSNRISAACGAADLLLETSVAEQPEKHRDLTSMISRNLRAIGEVLDDLLKLSQMDDVDGDRGGEAPLLVIVKRVTEELRGFAESNHVQLRTAENLPAVDVPAAVVQLALNNLISNGVKYRDASQSSCWVRVDAELSEGEERGVVVVRVSDNGLGVPEEKRARLFQRFFRAHEDVTGEEGSGLGLSIVKEAVEGADGRVWAEFPTKGSVFAFAVPCSDAAPREADTT